MAHIVLLGAGHVHLHLIRSCAQLQTAGHVVTVIAPEVFWYSGLASGVVAGDYPPKLDRIDVEALATQAGATYLRTTAAAIDAGSKTVTTADGQTVAYDVCSLNVGSTSDPSRLPGEHPRLYRVKPVRLLFDLSRELDERIARGEHPNLVVIGGGVTGAELACCFHHRLTRGGGQGIVALVARRGLTPELPARGRLALRRHIERQGIAFYETGVDRLDIDSVHLADGTRLRADAVVLATGPRAPAFLAASGLTCNDANGAVVVDQHLQVVNAPGVFAAGDCLHFAPKPLAKIGVFAVREAPILIHNLLAFLAGNPLRRFTPQDVFLSILNLGDRRAMAYRGNLLWSGRLAWWLKDRIDRKWLEMYR
jgi:NADH dehydrogenase FAD-containing subunit